MQVCMYKTVRDLRRESGSPVVSSCVIPTLIYRMTMKHKFKPSVGSNRARKSAPGGGRSEKQSSGVSQDQQPAAGIHMSC